MTLFPLGAYSVKCKGFTGIHHADTLLRKFRLSERRAREHGDRLRVALTRSPSLCAALTAAWKIRSTPRMWRAAKKKKKWFHANEEIFLIRVITEKTTLRQRIKQFGYVCKLGLDSVTQRVPQWRLHEEKTAAASLKKCKYSSENWTKILGFIKCISGVFEPSPTQNGKSKFKASFGINCVDA